MKIAVYPGSFDPITNGHLDVIERAAQLFDRLVVGVLVNPRKSPAAEAEARAAVVREVVAASLPADRFDVVTFDGLTVEFARLQGAGHIVRGLRAVSDFENELQMAHTNRKLAPEIDTRLLHDRDRARLPLVEPGARDRELRRATSARWCLPPWSGACAARAAGARKARCRRSTAKRLAAYERLVCDGARRRSARGAVDARTRPSTATCPSYLDAAEGLAFAPRRPRIARGFLAESRRAAAARRTASSQKEYVARARSRCCVDTATIAPWFAASCAVRSRLEAEADQRRLAAAAGSAGSDRP